MLHARVPFVARTQQCFAVKAGIDGLLDIARRSFCDTSEGNYFTVCSCVLLLLYLELWLLAAIPDEVVGCWQQYIILQISTAENLSCQI